MGSHVSSYYTARTKTLTEWRSYFGRRSIYIGGHIALLVILVGIGAAGFAPANDTIITTKRAAGPSAATGGVETKVNVAASWAIGSLLLIFTLVYDITVGPVCYAIVAESSSTRLRQKTIVMARMTYNVAGAVNNVLLPGMSSLEPPRQSSVLFKYTNTCSAQLNPGRWNWGAKTGKWSGGDHQALKLGC